MLLHLDVQRWLKGRDGPPAVYEWMIGSVQSVVNVLTGLL